MLTGKGTIQERKETAHIQISLELKVLRAGEQMQNISSAFKIKRSATKNNPVYITSRLPC